MRTAKFGRHSEGEHDPVIRPLRPRKIRPAGEGRALLRIDCCGELDEYRRDQWNIVSWKPPAPVQLWPEFGKALEALPAQSCTHTFV